MEESKEDIKKSNNKKDLKSSYFRDGKRVVDYLLLHDNSEGQKEKWRKTFEENLKQEGIQFETEVLESHEQQKEKKKKKKIFNCCKKKKTGDQEEPAAEKETKIVFVKIHMPFEAICKWAELTRMRKPIAKNDILEATKHRIKCSRKRWMKGFTLDADRLNNRGYMFDTKENKQAYFTAPFDRARMHRFLIDDEVTFFTNSERLRLISTILKTTRFSNSGIGIERMLTNGAYFDAYPLHAGPWKLPKMENKKTDEEAPKVLLNPRQTLYWLWARPGAWLYHQPLELIRSYFGEKIAVYFAWLGYYTEALIPVAIFGFFTFLYGLITVSGDDIQAQICNSDIRICPLCDICSFVPLNHSCFYSQITYVFDNTMTVAFAFVMSLWGQFFLEFWKRKREELAYTWDTNDITNEEGIVRAEFELLANKKKLNPVTGREEPYLSSQFRYKRITASAVTFLFMLLLVLAALFGIILYRNILTQIAYHGTVSGFIKKEARLIVSISASLINFIIITIMDVVYQMLAVKLTNLEAPRTQQAFEDSYTLKMFLFQAVNYYSSTFYAAFFRGRFAGTPEGYHRIGEYRLNECDPSGCLIEVFINLAMVMVLKQTLNNTKEILIPVLSNWLKKRKSRNLTEEIVETPSGEMVSEVEVSLSEKEMMDQPEFRDYALEPFQELGLFAEYLEMVIQYGFVTLFVTAFPLGPLFALINNVIEIRLDAYKFVTQFRRMVPDRSRDIGMWFSILQGISTAAVITNALLIGITSNFIPKTVYVLLYGPCSKPSQHTIHNCLSGYMNSTLNTIPVTQIQTMRNQPYVPSPPEIPEKCWFETSDPTEHYTGIVNHWHVYAATFIFIFVFEHVVFGLKILVDALIPDVPEHLVIQSRRQRLLETRMFYETPSEILEGERNDLGSKSGSITLEQPVEQKENDVRI